MAVPPSSHVPAVADSQSAFRADFAAELRARHVSLRQAEERSGWAKSTISRAINGSALPKIDLVMDVLAAIGVADSDLVGWRIRHQALHESAGDGAGSAADVTEKASRSRGSSTVLVLAVVVTAACAIVSTLLVVEWRSGDAAGRSASETLPSGPQVIEVHNKVALGSADLREDTSPVYLSSRTIGSCSRHGCKIEGTEMATGALVVTTCQARGAELVNFNLDSPEAESNPHAARSDLWYRVIVPDGRSGFISEVYIAPEDRGGLGLPPC